MWFFGKKKEVPEEPHAKYRIVKKEWSDGRVSFSIEEWTTHYESDTGFWLIMALSGKPCIYNTHEEASISLDKILKPLPSFIMTVMEER